MSSTIGESYRPKQYSDTEIYIARESLARADDPTEDLAPYPLEDRVNMCIGEVALAMQPPVKDEVVWAICSGAYCSTS